MQLGRYDEECLAAGCGALYLPPVKNRRDLASVKLGEKQPYGRLGSESARQVDFPKRMKQTVSLQTGIRNEAGGDENEYRDAHGEDRDSTESGFLRLDL